MLCGSPSVAADGTYFAGFDPSRVSPISSPDNITFDKQGNLWIATDGQTGTLGKNDGIYAVPTFPDGDIPRPTVVVVENTGGSRVIGK
jgi:secreted PhoX family phosphatase